MKLLMLCNQFTWFYTDANSIPNQCPLGGDKAVAEVLFVAGWMYNMQLRD